jgi:ribokinase
LLVNSASLAFSFAIDADHLVNLGSGIQSPMKNPGKATPKILVVGSANSDLTIRVPRLPKPGETVTGGAFSTAPGGKGANQAVAAARAGGDVTLIARLGNDAFASQAIEGFARDGIHVELISRDPKIPTGVALIIVGANGENSIAVASGANAALSASIIRNAASAFRGASAVLVQLETPLGAVQAVAALARTHGVPLILNPAPARTIPDSLLRLVSILTPNQSEAAALAGRDVRDPDSAAEAATVLRRRGAKAVIITLGKLGALVVADGVSGLVPGFKVKPVDTTAAGDVFNGAFAVALGEGKPLLEAARFANGASAISVTRPGAQPSAPTRREIEQFLATRGVRPRKKNFRNTSTL